MLGKHEDCISIVEVGQYSIGWEGVDGAESLWDNEYDIVDKWRVFWLDTSEEMSSGFSLENCNEIVSYIIRCVF